MRTVLITVSALLVVLGALVVLLGTVAFVDPADAQLSDDSNPFGQPLSRAKIALTVALGAIAMAGGARVLLRQRKGRAA